MFDRLKAAKRLNEHDDALASVQRRLTALEGQWTDTLDRLKVMMGRVLKERQTVQRWREEQGQQEPETHLSDEQVAAGQGSLTPQQQTINAGILARRNRTRSTQ